MVSLRQLFLNNIAQTSPSPLMLEIESAKGVFLYDRNGKAYYDAISGVNVSALGHNHPAIIEAAKNQLDRHMHVMVYGELIQSVQVEYASLLTSYLPENLESVYFVNSGSEAIEGALKLAKKYTGRSEMISFKKSYHGSTHGSLSIMGDEYFKKGYRPLLPDVRHLEFNDIHELENITEKTACVIAEVIQAEAGVRIPEGSFLKSIGDRCRETGALLILDEIQTGFGRTGTLFGFESVDIIPDILVLAKSFGGGMPLGAFIAGRDIMEVLSFDPVLGHITTFGGHPIACATGKATMEVILDENLAEQSLKKEKLFRECLTNENIREIRGRGLMLAVELGDSTRMHAVVNRGLETGFLTDWFLFCDTAFRISPPMNITEDEIIGLCNLMNEAIDFAFS